MWVRTLVTKRWIEAAEDELHMYHQHKDELSTMNGCVLWGSRAIVLQAGRALVLDLLHDGPPGTTKMKSIARQVVWWPNIDSDTTKKVQECVTCQVNQKDPVTAPVPLWKWPKKPWAWLYIDYTRPFQGKLLLILINAHLKWIEAVPVSSTSTAATVQVLRRLFATHGITELMISDNRTAFTSNEFHQSVERNGIRHCMSSPHHPVTNGVSEQAVQVVKNGLRKNPEGDMELILVRFLFHFWKTPHATTGLTPAKLLLGREPRTYLDLIHLDIAAQVRNKQYAQKETKDGKTPIRAFREKDQVYIRNFQHGDKWLPVTTAKTLVPRYFMIRLDQGMTTVWRHLDHVKGRCTKTTVGNVDDFVCGPFNALERLEEPSETCSDAESPAANREVQRSSWIRCPPNRFILGTNWGWRECNIHSMLTHLHFCWVSGTFCFHYLVFN